MYYAQITLPDRIVYAVTETHAVIEDPTLIEVDGLRVDLFGKRHNETTGEFEVVAVEIVQHAAGPMVQPWTKKEFLLKFTPQEYAAISAATKVNGTIDYYWMLFMVADDVLKTDPTTVAGIQTLETFGLLATGRAAEILA